jgi:flagellar biosynthetic protein FliR
MNADDAAFLSGLPGWAFDFVLLLARISATIMVIPALGEQQIPPLMRAGIALALTLLLLPILAPELPHPPPDIWQEAALLGEEMLIGLWLGWLARLIMLALPIAGQIISFMTGLANVLQNDGINAGQVTALSHFFEIAAPVIIFGTGLFALPLSAMVGSYHVIPPGSALPNGDIAQTVVSGVAQSFSLAFRLAAPFVLADVTWQVSIGLLSRMVPSLQLFLIAMPGQILGGLLLLALLGMSLIGAWDDTVRSLFMGLPGQP